MYDAYLLIYKPWMYFNMFIFVKASMCKFYSRNSCYKKVICKIKTSNCGGIFVIQGIAACSSKLIEPMICLIVTDDVPHGSCICSLLLWMDFTRTDDRTH